MATSSLDTLVEALEREIRVYSAVRDMDASAYPHPESPRLVERALDQLHRGAVAGALLMLKRRRARWANFYHPFPGAEEGEAWNLQEVDADCHPVQRLIVILLLEAAKRQVSEIFIGHSDPSTLEVRYRSREAWETSMRPPSKLLRCLLGHIVALDPLADVFNAPTLKDRGDFDFITREKRVHARFQMGESQGLPCMTIELEYPVQQPDED